MAVSMVSGRESEQELKESHLTSGTPRVFYTFPVDIPGIYLVYLHNMISE
jgi:hypothetical protein